MLPPQCGELAQSALQVSTAFLHQLTETPVVALDLVAFLTVANGPALQPLDVLLTPGEALVICGRRGKRVTRRSRTVSVLNLLTLTVPRLLVAPGNRLL